MLHPEPSDLRAQRRLGYAVVLLSEVPDELQDVARKALEQCPEHAITIEE